MRVNSPDLRIRAEVRLPERSRLGRPTAFTLVEVMIVISIMAIIIAAGVPSLFRALQKDQLHKAVNDIMEGCSYARAQAILQGVPCEFVIREDGTMTVAKVNIPALGSGGGAPANSAQPPNPSGGSSIFNAHWGEDVAPELLDVNNHDLMQAAEARVRFHPNGTSDEFTIVISSPQGSFKISLDIMTGLANSERLR